MLPDLAATAALVGLPVTLGHKPCCHFVPLCFQYWFLFLLCYTVGRQEPTVIFLFHYHP